MVVVGDLGAQGGCVYADAVARCVVGASYSATTDFPKRPKPQPLSPSSNSRSSPVPKVAAFSKLDSPKLTSPRSRTCAN